MLGRIAHVGITVSDIERSIAFYRDVLGLKFVGRLEMNGAETDALFGGKNIRVFVAYLEGSGRIGAPPVELIQFADDEAQDGRASLFKRSISEICFEVEDIRAEYERLSAAGVEFLSAPQEFDFSSDGFGRSIAVYFKDPDGIILELMQYV